MKGGPPPTHLPTYSITLTLPTTHPPTPHTHHPCILVRSCQEGVLTCRLPDDMLLGVYNITLELPYGGGTSQAAGFLEVDPMHQGLARSLWYAGSTRDNAGEFLGLQRSPWTKGRHLAPHMVQVTPSVTGLTRGPLDGLLTITGKAFAEASTVGRAESSRLGSSLPPTTHPTLITLPPQHPQHPPTHAPR